MMLLGGSVLKLVDRERQRDPGNDGKSEKSDCSPPKTQTRQSARPSPTTVSKRPKIGFVVEPFSFLPLGKGNRHLVASTRPGAFGEADGDDG
jgi:hypothetical protein